MVRDGLRGVVANLSPGEAEDIDPGDVTTRQSLGSWRVSNGQGNVQSTFGEGSFTATTGNHPSPTEGVLDILDSDIVGNFSAGEGGTLRLTASLIDNISVSDEGSAYLSMGSRAKILTTRSGAYLQIDESSVTGLLLRSCRLMETTILGLPATVRGLRDRDFPRTGAWPTSWSSTPRRSPRAARTWPVTSLPTPSATSSTCAGYRAVVVNGVVRVEDGKHRGAVPGHVLREA